MKTCTKCGVQKEEDAFEPRRKTCKSCRSRQRQENKLHAAKEAARQPLGSPKKPVESPEPPVGAYPTPESATSSVALRTAPEANAGVEDIKKDFRKFLYIVWMHTGLPEPTCAQYDMAYQLQHGPKRLCIQAFRGIGKSWITVTFAAWCLLNDPQLKIMVVSATKDRADANATFLKRMIEEIPVLMHLRPREGQRSSRLIFDVGPATNDQSPSVKSVGITGQLTGSRADLLIADDIEILSNSATNDMREKLLNLTKEFSAILKTGDLPRIIWLGTPQTEDSIYNKLSAEYVTMIWPARIPGQDLIDAYGDKLAPYIWKMINEGSKEGTPVDPKRFHNEDLMSREADYGRAGFALQFMLSTQLSDEEKYPLKLKDFVVLEEIPQKRAPMKVEWLPDPRRKLEGMTIISMGKDTLYYSGGSSDVLEDYETSILAIDPAGRGKDEMGYCILKLLNGFIYIRKLGGLMGGYEAKNLEFLSKLAKTEEVNEVVVETNFGDGMFEELLTPVLRAQGYPCTVTGKRSSGQKERRIIDVLEPILNQHKLVIGRGTLEDDYKSVLKYPEESRLTKTLMHQMTRMTYDRGAVKHDDRVDVLAIGVNHLTEGVARDTEDAIRETYEARMREDLLKFLEHHQETPVNTGGAGEWGDLYG